MADYTKLVEALKRLCQAQDADHLDWAYGSQQAMHDAAAAIEELQAEVGQWKAAVKGQEDGIKVLQAEVERLNLEIDKRIATEIELSNLCDALESKRGEMAEVVRCAECNNGRQGHGIPNGRVLCAKPFMGDTVAGAMHDNDWYCADGVKMEVQE